MAVIKQGLPPQETAVREVSGAGQVCDRNGR